MKRQPPKHIERLLDSPREVRSYPARGMELRLNGDGQLEFTGYATVYGAEYEMYGGPPWGWIESVEPRSGAKTLSEDPDVQLLINHDGLPLARTKSGTMTLAEDNTGLNPRAQLEPTDPDVQRIQPKIARNDLTEMSFAFRVTRQEWDENYERRWIREYSLHRGDVSIVNYGANPSTSFSLREMLVDADPERLLDELRAAGRFNDLGPLIAHALADESPDFLAALNDLRRGDGAPPVERAPEAQRGDVAALFADAERLDAAAPRA